MIYRPSYYLTRPHKLVSELWREKIKWPLQRMFRGYSDRDLWSLDTRLAEIIVLHLKAFRQQRLRGTPIECYPDGAQLSPDGFTEEQDDAAHAAWLAAIDDMIAAFELAADDYGQYESVERLEKNMAIVNKGLRMFVEHFASLWD